MTTGDSMRTTCLLRALVVEDDELTRQTIVEMLEGMGCQVAAVRGAQEAVLTFLAGQFDLITLDHRMPGLSGMELHRVLSQEFGAGKRTAGFAARKLCDVVLVTGYGDDPEVVCGRFGEGIVGVVQKPFIEEGLGRIVRGLVEKGCEPPVPLPEEAGSRPS